MYFDNLQLQEPLIEKAIDPNPLTVTLGTSIFDAITLMNQQRVRSRSQANLSPENLAIQQARCGYVLVIEGEQLFSIFTEKDIVKLTARSVNFHLKISEVMTASVITLEKSKYQDIFGVLYMLLRHQIRHLPIIGEQGELIGVVTQETLRSILRPIHMLKIMRVLSVMTKEVICAPQTASILSLAQVMAEYSISCIVIVESDKEPIGIITERDIVQLQTMQLQLSEIQAHLVMSAPLFLLTPEDSLWKAQQEMQKRLVRRLVVSWDKGLGLVTQSSLLKAIDPFAIQGIIETLEQTIGNANSS